MAAPIDAFLVTCEHGGNRIPAAFRPAFRGYAALLASHRGYDAGALTMARDLAGAFGAPLELSTVSRLLVDLNRSRGHPRLFSEAMRQAPASLRDRIVATYYAPYRARVERWVQQAHSRRRRTIHVSSHSFTPSLDAAVRTADVGLLYDPRRRGETALCARWKAALAVLAPQLRVRRNYPYAGKGDGLTAYLRRRFPDDAYVGIELEVNQEIVFAGVSRWRALRGVLIESLRTACRGQSGLSDKKGFP